MLLGAGSGGTKIADILQKLTRTDLGNAAFPWLSSKLIEVGLAPAMAFRMNLSVNWAGIAPSIEYQNHIFDAIMAAGAAFGIKPFGIRAMDAMRLEKSYRLVGTELSIEYAALESGFSVCAFE
ncbi:MAG: hypothetical protein CM15mP46_5440 [Alphaproteobacteria bacterium]|nr:MAG: hypothetical protein CM15mP46_5440 [Alphaproteobacteria bacterium]